MVQACVVVEVGTSPTKAVSPAGTQASKARAVKVAAARAARMAARGRVGADCRRHESPSRNEIPNC